MTSPPIRQSNGVSLAFGVHSGPAVVRTSTSASVVVRSSARTEPSVSIHANSRAADAVVPSPAHAASHGPAGVQLKSIDHVN
ncbi:hypothetical protein [Streptomyces sp. KL116D]|uniref:hypothetical protein n=1 Tax=Streptomyces sp. KL116D TaxID=3045152 RepID=UPI0035572384